MVLLLGAATIGLILAMLALGVYVSFRTFRFPDITAEGSLTLGAAVSATLLVQQWSPWLATLAAFGAGLIAGAVTGTLHTKFKINGLLSGILVMTALYSINLHIMGKSNVALSQSTTLVTQTEEVTQRLLGTIEQVDVLGWSVNVRDLAIFFGALLLITILSSLLYLFYKTNLGTAMRASGDNPQMIRALGVSDETLLVLGLALANGFIALSGAFLTQYQGFADVQMGIGMVVWGLASVIIGEALVGTSKIGLLIASTVLGSILFRLLIAIALRWGLNPNDLKLITAVFVLVALIAPSVIRKWKFSGIKVTTAA